MGYNTRMNQFFANLGSVASNMHVSVPAILAFACEAGKIWMPAHAAQWDSTQKALYTYSIIAAGNSSPAVPQQNQPTPPKS